MSQPEAHGARTFTPMRNTDLEQGKDGFWAVCFRNLLNLTDSEIRLNFSQYGDVGSIRSAGPWTFVRFRSEEEARKCIEDEHASSYLGDIIKPARNTNFKTHNAPTPDRRGESNSVELELDLMPAVDFTQPPPSLPALRKPSTGVAPRGRAQGGFIRGRGAHFTNTTPPNFRARGRGNFHNPRPGYTPAVPWNATLPEEEVRKRLEMLARGTALPDPPSTEQSSPAPTKNSILADMEQMALSKENMGVAKMNGASKESSARIQSHIVISNLPTQFSTAELLSLLRRDGVANISVETTPDNIRYCLVQVDKADAERQLLELDKQPCQGQQIFAKKVDEMIATTLKVVLTSKQRIM